MINDSAGENHYAKVWCGACSSSKLPLISAPVMGPSTCKRNITSNKETTCFNLQNS